MQNWSGILIYQTEDGITKIETHLQEETVWLNQMQLAEPFQKSKSTISEHLTNIFEEEELDKNSVVRYFRTTEAIKIPTLKNYTIFNRFITFADYFLIAL